MPAFGTRLVGVLLFLGGCHGFLVGSRSALGSALHGVATSTQEGASSQNRAPAVDDPEKIRNVALVGHSHAGKSSLAEFMLYDDKVITKKPQHGEPSMLDSDSGEAHRRASIFSHFVRIPHGNYLLQVADTPWHDFPSAALAAVDGADSAVLIVSAADGVQAGSINAYQHCQQAGIKTIVALNKMDRPFVQANQVVGDMETQFGIKPVPLQVPVFDENQEFEGVVPLILLDEQGTLVKNTADGLDEAWMELEEAVAMTDDDLLVEYLENSELEPQAVFNGLRSAVRQAKILPLVYTSAEKDLGVSSLMDAMAICLPNPVEMRKETLDAACEQEQGGMCGLEPGVEAGFSARVLHTIVDSFGSLSVLRVITNSRSSQDKEETFDSLPSQVVVLRTGETIKMPSTTNAVGLLGKERQPLADNASIVPGDIIAVPKLPVTVETHDILTIPSAQQEEEDEISMEVATDALSPLSRHADNVALMASATISVPESSGGHKKSKGKGNAAASDDKLLGALKAMAREDLAMEIDHDPSGMLLLRCMSGDHLQIVAERLKDRYSLDVELGQPPVQYRETLVKVAKNVEGRHKKQSGGSGQFGVCFIDMEPLEEGAGVEFESRIKGGVISKPFISSVEKGVREQLQSGGPLAGYPVTDVKITLVDGKMHSVDSKDIAFQSAGKLAVKAALEKAKTKLLQPMEKLTFVADDKLRGEINTIVARGGGYVTNSNVGDGTTFEVEAILPTASVGDVSNLLRAASGGAAQFTSEFSHYQQVPEDQLRDIVKSVDEPKLHP